MKPLLASCIFIGWLLAWAVCPPAVQAQDTDALTAQATTAMSHAAQYYRSRVASHGGYVYFYSLDLKQRWGEGAASPDQIWVQPPGTPTVGLAYLKAYEATEDPFYLEAATAAAEALVYGQMKSGGWTNCVDFDPRGARVAQYRNGRGRGRNTSSLDDGQTQSAIRLLMHVDRAQNFENQKIHDAAQVALDALLEAQLPNGELPQVWDDDVVPDPRPQQANYPDYDWRIEGRIENFWDMYTLNDNVTGYVADVLIEAAEIYQQPRYASALQRLGDFLISAQMPEPQPGWAQQYNYQMQPIWAQKFEPPGVSGDETQEVIETLMKIADKTRDRKYLEPIPAALTYLKRSQLSDGRLARYYELKTNRPLYMVRRGQTYTLTYDDADLPAHYGWKTESRIGELGEKLASLKSEGRLKANSAATDDDVRKIVASLDDQGRWISKHDGQRLVGQPKMTVGQPYLSSEQFSRNLTTLADYVRRRSATPRP